MDKLFNSNALDVWFIPIIMKKNRPAIKISVLISSENKEEAIKIILTESSSIGVRILEVDRVELDRKIEEVKTSLGTIKVKIAYRDGNVINVSPEYEDCARIAKEKDMPLKEVFRLAAAAYEKEVEGRK